MVCPQMVINMCWCCRNRKSDTWLKCSLLPVPHSCIDNTCTAQHTSWHGMKESAQVGTAKHTHTVRSQRLHAAIHPTLTVLAHCCHLAHACCLPYGLQQGPTHFVHLKHMQGQLEQQLVTTQLQDIKGVAVGGGSAGQQQDMLRQLLQQHSRHMQWC